MVQGLHPTGLHRSQLFDLFCILPLRSPGHVAANRFTATVLASGPVWEIFGVSRSVSECLGVGVPSGWQRPPVTA